MNILITGGAGFIGSHTADALLRRGDSVRVLDNLQKPVHLKGKPNYLSDEIEFVFGDVRDREALGYALEGVDTVLHLAAYQDYLPDFSTYFHVNAVSTALIYELIVERKLAVKRVVVASSQAVLGEGTYECFEHGLYCPDIRVEKQLRSAQWDHRCPKCASVLKPIHTPEDAINPRNQYALSKHSLEEIALSLGRRYEIPSVALRYSIVQGPRQSFYNAYSGAMRIFALSLYFDRPPTIYEDGEQLRDYVNIGDVVDANLLALDAPRAEFEVFNVGGGKGYSVRDFYENHAGSRWQANRGAYRWVLSVRRYQAYRLRYQQTAVLGVGAEDRHRAEHSGLLGLSSVPEEHRQHSRVRGQDHGQVECRAHRRYRLRFMKAVLLAAGLGTRLRPITDDVPKCLVPIGGIPLLEYWLRAFERYAVTDVLINTHYLAEQVVEFVQSRRPSPKVTLAHEPELLGSAGTVLANRSWIGNDEAFIIAYADNLTNMDLADMVDVHLRSRSVATIGLFETDVPEQCGVVEMDDAGTIWNFVEKSPRPPSRLANAGIYVASQAIFDTIPVGRPVDFGFDVFPRLKGKLKGYRLDGYFRDIGDLERYAQAQTDVQSVAF
jgi:dTDP-L-rhamnose 4-epimerase